MDNKDLIVFCLFASIVFIAGCFIGVAYQTDQINKDMDTKGIVFCNKSIQYNNDILVGTIDYSIINVS